MWVAAEVARAGGGVVVVVRAGARAPCARLRAWACLLARRERRRVGWARVRRGGVGARVRVRRSRDGLGARRVRTFRFVQNVVSRWVLWGLGVAEARRGVGLVRKAKLASR